MEERGVKNGFKLKQPTTYIDCYKQKMLYTNLLVTINQKPVIDMERIKRKEAKYIIKKASEPWKKQKKRSEKNYKNKHKNNKIKMNIYQSITLNVNGLNAPIKRHG